MTTQEQRIESLEELTTLATNGPIVTLLWRRADKHLKVTVCDDATEDEFEIEVGTRSPMDVFHHSYAYASRGKGPSACISPRELYGASTCLPEGLT
jgi:hypothetical protein